MFQPSNPMRHGAEVCRVLSECDHCSDTGELIAPFMFIYTDGGSDHRTTYRSVQASYICLFFALNLDMLVAVRCCPQYSWTNLAERCMPILNLALQNVALQKSSMASELEEIIKKKKTMDELRSYTETNAAFKQLYVQSMQPVIELLNGRFGRMKLKGEKVKTFTAVQQPLLEKFFKLIHKIDNQLEQGNITKKVTDKSAGWKRFISKHCKISHYYFQVKKCVDDDCEFCRSNPPRSPKFSELHFLPDPILCNDKVSYKTFTDLYGTDTDGRDRPSSKSQDVSKEIDSQYKIMLVAGRVRDAIACCECNKLCCIYAQSTLNVQQMLMVNKAKEDGYYCGLSLFPEGHSLHSTIRVRMALNCTSNIEAAYYGAPRCFDTICVFCGSAEDIAEMDDILEFMQKFHTVRPVCSYYESGKRPLTRGPKNVKATKKPRLS